MGACFVIGTNTYYKTSTHWSYHIIYYFDSRTQWGLVLTSNTKHAPIGCVNSQWVLVLKTSPHWVRESPMAACFVATGEETSQSHNACRLQMCIPNYHVQCCVTGTVTFKYHVCVGLSNSISIYADVKILHFILIIHV